MLGDIVIVGAGIFGLSIARRCLAAGLGATLVDAAAPGAGASGGPLGALGPYMPDGWSAKKAFQLHALHDLGAEIAAIEEAAGLNCQYQRCGRVQPLFTEKARELAGQRVAAAEQVWRLPDGSRYSLGLLDQAPPALAGLPTAPYGYLVDDLTARVAPASYCAALFEACRRAGARYINDEVVEVDGEGGRLITSGGFTIDAGMIVIAAGYRSFELITKGPASALGHGVRGRVLVKKALWSLPMPVIHTKGCYIVSHANGEVAIGGSVETPGTDSEQAVADLNARAAMLVPALAAGEVLRAWSGYRPNATIRAPLVGKMAPRLWAATGGYGIGLGIAHRVAQVVIEGINGAPTLDYPPNFNPAVHLEAAR